VIYVIDIHTQYAFNELKIVWIILAFLYVYMLINLRIESMQSLKLDKLKRLIFSIPFYYYV